MSDQNKRSETMIYDNNCTLPQACFATRRIFGTTH